MGAVKAPGGFAQKVFLDDAFCAQNGAFWSQKIAKMRPESPY
jgi:hypothetical protein